MTTPTEPLWAIVPAAGIGARMQAQIPKQYLQLHGQSILQTTLDKLTHIKGLSRIVVALHPNDQWFSERVNPHPLLTTVAGGDSRAQSVLNALQYACKTAPEAWVLVHDAARPCVALDAVHRLIEAVTSGSDGGLLAIPAADTLKQVANTQVQRTIDRSQVWLAHTPQMFRAQQLCSALEQALDDGFEVTDEASAMEHAGFQPIVVRDSRSNLKITEPEDLALAQWLLGQQK